MEATLTTADRCDKCGAQAQTEWATQSGTLLYCGHDTRALGAAMVANGYRIINAAPEAVREAVA